MRPAAPSSTRCSSTRASARSTPTPSTTSWTRSTRCATGAGSSGSSATWPSCATGSPPSSRYKRRAGLHASRVRPLARSWFQCAVGLRFESMHARQRARPDVHWRSPTATSATSPWSRARDFGVEPRRLPLRAGPLPAPRRARRRAPGRRDAEDLGFAVRVIHDGAWGFAVRGRADPRGGGAGRRDARSRSQVAAAR